MGHNATFGKSEPWQRLTILGRTRGSGKPQRKSAKRLTRRDFVKTGAAAGLGAGALLGPDQADAQGASTGLDDTTWDYEVDVVIAGAGCAGLTAAIRARDLGASVLVVDSNFDAGGRMLLSGSHVSLGGGDPPTGDDGPLFLGGDLSSSTGRR